MLPDLRALCGLAQVRPRAARAITQWNRRPKCQIELRELFSQLHRLTSYLIWFIQLSYGLGWLVLHNFDYSESLPFAMVTRLITLTWHVICPYNLAGFRKTYSQPWPIGRSTINILLLIWVYTGQLYRKQALIVWSNKGIYIYSHRKCLRLINDVPKI